MRLRCSQTPQLTLLYKQRGSLWEARRDLALKWDRTSENIEVSIDLNIYGEPADMVIP